MYLDEIEKYFIKKRKKFLILNPRDWVLIEKWYNMGIPIKVVKKGIDQSFETFFSNEENIKSGRTLNTIRYCESVILELWREYKENSIGISHSEEEDFDDKKYTIEKLSELKNNLISSGEYLKEKNEESIVKLLRNLYKQINSIEKDLIEGKITPVDLEYKLFSLQQNFMKKVFDDTSSMVLKKINSEANGRLEKYKNKMSKQAYEKTLNSVISKDLRKYYNLPEINF